MKRAVITPRKFSRETPILTIDHETGELTLEGEFDIKEIDLETYVQVSFDINDIRFGAKLYTYIDPWKTLAVGDLVDVPTQYKEHNVAIVKKLGDGYKGQSHSSVSGRYGIVELSPEFWSR